MLTKLHREKIKYLSQYRYLNSEIDRNIKRLSELRERLFCISQPLSDMPKTLSKEDKTANSVARIVDIENEINKDIDELIKLRKRIEEKINKIKDLRLKEILKCRYLDCKSWEEIAYENKYSWRHVFRMHEKALDEIKI